MLLRAAELKNCALLFVELSQYKQRQPSTPKPNGAEHGGVLSYLEACGAKATRAQDHDVMNFAGVT